MTLIPSESWAVAGVEGEKYKVAERCAAPGCKRYPDHLHHLWRRSFLGKAYWWVTVPVNEDGTETATIRNVVGLCAPHHDDVTGTTGGHKAWIQWWPEPKTLVWMEADTSGHWKQVGYIDLPPTPETPPPAKVEGRCPTCGRVKHAEHKEHAPGPKRARKTWTVKVPADKEDGAAVLDELIEQVAEIFGMDDYGSSKRYFVLAQALVICIQNSHLIATEIDQMIHH